MGNDLVIRSFRQWVVLQVHRTSHNRHSTFDSFGCRRFFHSSYDRRYSSTISCQPCPDRTTVFLHEQIQTEEKDFPAEISEGNWGGARGCDGSAENRSTNASWCCRGCGSSVDDTGYRKWDRAAHRDRRPLDAGRASPRSPRLDRDQDRLRPRRMWSLHGVARRSEERRVGKECRSRWWRGD